jgi:hypothetical protein
VARRTCYHKTVARVRVGTCSGPAHAALVRAAFEAHDIPVFINAEQHASMLGGMGGVFVPLHVYVGEEDVEEAAVLMKELDARASEPIEHEEPEDDDDEGASGVDARVDRRRRTGVVLLLAMCITFGTAHMYTGAWLRGLCLAGIEIFAFRTMMTEPKLGTALLLACIAADLVGALLNLRKQRIPEARLRR